MNKKVCPDCNGDNIKFTGYRKSEKDRSIIAERYICLNEDCERKGFSVRLDGFTEQSNDSQKESSNSFKYEEKKDQAVVQSDDYKTQTVNKAKVLEEFLELCQVDTEVWEVEKYTLNAWDVTMSGTKSSTGEDVAYTNYQIKVWLKPRKETFDTDKFKRELIEDVKKNHAPNINIKGVYTDSDNLFIPNLFDIHLGRLCWYEETGENYDVNIATQITEQVLQVLFKRYNDLSSIDRILFPVGQDFFNYDYAEPFPMTTNQTPQESDVRWQKMFRLGRNLLYGMIDWMCAQVAPVDVVVSSGNHEAQVGWYLGELLDAKYENNNAVTVDNRPIQRKYYRYGVNLIGFAHGKDEKEAELHNLMSLEAPQKWAQSKYRYFYLGHNHYERSLNSKTSKAIINQEVDYKGVYIEYLPAIARVDKYEHAKGFIGSVRGARAMVHNFNSGRIHKIGENL